MGIPLKVLVRHLGKILDNVPEEEGVDEYLKVLKFRLFRRSQYASLIGLAMPPDVIDLVLGACIEAHVLRQQKVEDGEVLGVQVVGVLGALCQVAHENDSDRAHKLHLEEGLRVVEDTLKGEHVCRTYFGVSLLV